MHSENLKELEIGVLEFILPEHKNEIFEYCKAKGIRLENFNFYRSNHYFFQTLGNRNADLIEFRTSNYRFYFAICKAGDEFVVEISPGLDIMVENKKRLFGAQFSNKEPQKHIKDFERSFHRTDWSSVMALIYRWIDKLKDNQEDLFFNYQQISSQFLTIFLESEYDNSFYTEDEMEAINKKIDILTNEILVRFDLVDSQVEILKKEIEFLKSQLQTQKRKDFKLIFHNALVTIFVNYASDPDKFQKLIAIVQSIFSTGTNFLLGK